ncbi:MAG: tetratricopeptide repeat protein [Nitrospiraceae bacterium]|nr:tetratricopeptide repeat protein [Nitrospiraceae bacterium]
MEKKGHLRIKAQARSFLETNVTAGEGEKYLVFTETGADRGVITRIFLKGALINSRKTACRPYTSISQHMQNQHEFAIKMLKSSFEQKVRTSSDYLSGIKDLVKRKKYNQANDLLSEALLRYPEDAVLLSYGGFMEARLNGNRAEGIAICERCIADVMRKVPFGADFFYPTLYLNLGRACLAAGDKERAVLAFRQGLHYDHEDRELLWEMKKLGVRRKPVFPCLSRSNPLNKYSGMLRAALGGRNI